jgi:hypothetical protein
MEDTMALNQKPVTAPTSGPINKTPAPVAKEKTFGRESYGSNAFDGPPSIAPGKTVTSPLADDLKQHAGSLGDVIANGTAKPAPDWQTRDVSSAPLPAAHGMRSRNREK